MSIIERYLLRELFKVLFAVILILSLLIASVSFIQLLEKAAIGSLHPQVVLPLISYQVLRYIPRTLPPAFFLAILAVLGQLYRNYEMTALAACGIGTVYIYRTLGLGLILIVPITAWLSLIMQPWAAGSMDAILTAQKQTAAELIGLKPGRFQEFRHGKIVFYIETIDQQAEEMRNIFIQNRQDNKLSILRADIGKHIYDGKTHQHFLILQNGRRYQGIPGQANFTISEFGTYTLRIVESKTKARDVRAARTSMRLYMSDDIHDKAEFWERISYPISLITLMLVAIPLSRSLPRQGVYGRLFWAFLVYFIFLNTHAIAVSWMRKQVTPEWLGIWWVQALLIIFAFLAVVWDSSWVKRFRRWLQHPISNPTIIF
ncbi:hypothetical protein TI05_06210 [Achromatium sp. WMS3]|nr:hypothetical protein TI05_06210 [Achromatium sp. WMS3]